VLDVVLALLLGERDMATRIAVVDRIIARIGVTVDVDAGDGGVVGVGREKAPEVGVVVAGVEPGQADRVAEPVRRANTPPDRLPVRLIMALAAIGAARSRRGR
jgi:hypothetical protein